MYAHSSAVSPLKFQTVVGPGQKTRGLSPPPTRVYGVQLAPNGVAFRLAKGADAPTANIFEDEANKRTARVKSEAHAGAYSTR